MDEKLNEGTTPEEGTPLDQIIPTLDQFIGDQQAINKLQVALNSIQAETYKQADFFTSIEDVNEGKLSIDDFVKTMKFKITFCCGFNESNMINDLQVKLRDDIRVKIIEQIFPGRSK